MLKANLHIIKELKLFLELVIQDSEVLSLFSTTPNGFRRRRKLPFDRLALLITKLCKKTLSVELDTFFSECGVDSSCTVSAFCQQRMKLDPIFFRVWNKLLCMCFYSIGEVKRWKGYRVVAVDGSNLPLVNTPVLREHFGGQSNQSGFFVQAKAVYSYDVLNGLLLTAELVPYRTAELQVTYPMVDRFEEDMLLIYDRNFCNYKMIALHLWQEKEQKFVIRAKEDMSVYRNFIESGKTSAIVQLPPTPSAIKGLHQQGYILNKETMLTVRLVRVELPNSVEVLVTNLWEEDGHDYQLFKELYFMRWSIETNIGHQKNILQLESFSGLSIISVQQDFYATIFTANLQSLLVSEAQKTVDERTKKGKYAMKVNGNKSFGRLKANIVQLFLCNQPESILEILQQYFVRDTLPIRPGRTFPRVIKNKMSKSKHKTFTNYKPAF